MKSEHECDSDDEKLGSFDLVEECADACRQKEGCTFFLFGLRRFDTGDCYWEKTPDASCRNGEGWESDNYDFYELLDYTIW